MAHEDHSAARSPPSIRLLRYQNRNPTPDSTVARTTLWSPMFAVFKAQSGVLVPVLLGFLRLAHPDNAQSPKRAYSTPFCTGPASPVACRAADPICTPPSGGTDSSSMDPNPFSNIGSQWIVWCTKVQPRELQLQLNVRVDNLTLRFMPPRFRGNRLCE
jgi:hypothetical protein